MTVQGGLTASAGISSSRGDYTSLYINGVEVVGGTGLSAQQVSGAITGALVDYANLTASNTFTSDMTVQGGLTASAGISSSRGDYTSLYINGVEVVGGTGLSAQQVSGAITASLAGYANLTASNVFTTTQQITGGLSMTGDLSARSASLTGDLTVNGNLTVKGTTTQINSNQLNVGDFNINLFKMGTGPRYNNWNTKVKYLHSEFVNSSKLSFPTNFSQIEQTDFVLINNVFFINMTF